MLGRKAGTATQGGARCQGGSGRQGVDRVRAGRWAWTAIRPRGRCAPPAVAFLHFGQDDGACRSLPPLSCMHVLLRLGAQPTLPC